MLITQDEVQIQTAAEECVENGIAFLDERIPWWRNDIDINSLWLGNDCDCVLGQTAGGYFQAVLRFGLTLEKSDRLGFSAFETDYGYMELTAAWKAALA